MTNMLGLVFLPFSSALRMQANQSRMLTREETSFEILKALEPKRPPRFFYRGKFLVEYSEMKAKLQLNVESRDIEKGVTTITTIGTNPFRYSSISANSTPCWLLRSS